MPKWATPDEIRKLFPHASKSTILRNLVGGLPAEAGKLQEPPALVSETSGNKSRPKRMARGRIQIRVGLVRVSCHELDYDGLVSSLKSLRDAISTSLGIDDGDARIKFAYSQLQSGGRRGVIVTIERIKPSQC